MNGNNPTVHSQPPHPAPAHQYIDSETGEVLTEQLFGDPVIRFVYSELRERMPWMYRAVTASRMSHLLGMLNFETLLGARLSGQRRWLQNNRIDLAECVEPPHRLDTPRKVFERKIRYWETRPMPPGNAVIVSPADSRVLIGSLNDHCLFEIKNKFFEYEELLAADKPEWLETFRGGNIAIFRLTPEKYHYNHVPVSGTVLDAYDIPGRYHSCNPSAVILLVTPYSKNKRSVTILDTDVPGGTGVGRVAMIEVVALMIGDILQSYSAEGYDDPQPVTPGMFLKKGQPKSLFRPGSSTTVLLFEKGRMQFNPRLLFNQRHPWASSRFSRSFGKPLVETDVKVRSEIGAAWEKE